jgi:hypothetical protein
MEKEKYVKLWHMKHTNHSDNSAFSTYVSYKENQLGGILMKKIIYNY